MFVMQDFSYIGKNERESVRWPYYLFNLQYVSGCIDHPKKRERERENSIEVYSIELGEIWCQVFCSLQLLMLIVKCDIIFIWCLTIVRLSDGRKRCINFAPSPRLGKLLYSYIWYWCGNQYCVVIAFFLFLCQNDILSTQVIEFKQEWDTFLYRSYLKRKGEL